VVQALGILLRDCLFDGLSQQGFPVDPVVSEDKCANAGAPGIILKGEGHRFYVAMYRRVPRASKQFFPYNILKYTLEQSM
jgi:hypothetical protein